MTPKEDTMRRKIYRDSFSPWFRVECVTHCGWAGSSGGIRIVSEAIAKKHVRETGHETTVTKLASVHYRFLR